MKLRWLWVVAMLVAACGDSSTTPRSEEAPEWLKRLIVRLEAEPVANPPAVIAQYRYLGGTVYYLAPRCCDVPSELYSVAGDLMCHPDGGIGGEGDGKCAGFFAQARYERVVWRDARCER